MQSQLQELIAFLNKFADFSPEEVNENSQLKADLGLDSLTLVAIADQAEEEYGIIIDDDEFMSIRTVGDIMAIIEKSRETI